jgi:hypothetical protein
MADPASAVFLTAVGVNAGINLVQCGSSLFSRLCRWISMSFSRKLSVSFSQNPTLFYQITKLLDLTSKTLKHRTSISFGDSKYTHVYTVPECNSTVELELDYGDIWIMPIALDGYNISAYEITCWESEGEVIDEFYIRMAGAIKPPMPENEFEDFKRQMGMYKAKTS